MSRLSKTISALHGGISRQLPGLRFDTQHEDALNVYDDPVYGLRRRPGIELLGLSNEALSTSYWHHDINRDASERYKLSFTGDAETPLIVHDLTGASYPVVPATEDELDYLVSTDPKSDIRAVTVADTTFVSNKSVAPAMVALTAPFKPDVAFITVEGLVTYTNKYYITFNMVGSELSFTIEVTKGAGISSVAEMAVEILEALNDYVAPPDPPVGDWVPHYVAEYVGTEGVTNIIRLKSGESGTAPPGEDPFTHFTVSVTSDFGGTGYISSVQNYVEKRTDVPARAFDEDILRVRSESGLGGNDYYLQYDATGMEWTEVPSPDVAREWDTDTLPHIITRKQDDGEGTITGIPDAIYFEVAEAPWEDRQVGDDDSAPIPSFVEHGSIDGLFVFKNRLGFIAGNKVVFSRANDLYNLWPTTATEVLDDDPIDIMVSASEVVSLRWGAPFDDVLVLIGNGKQFVVHSGSDTFAPQYVNVKETTQLPIVENVKPAFSGSALFFLSQADGYAQLREYFVEAEGLSDEAPDASAHVPGLLRSTITELVSLPEHDVLLLVDPTTGTHLIYRYMWRGAEKVQSSFTRLRCERLDTITCFAAESTVYLFGDAYDSQSVVCRLPMALNSQTGQPFPVHLDLWYNDGDISSNEVPNPGSGTYQWRFAYPLTLHGVAHSDFRFVSETGQSIKYTGLETTFVGPGFLWMDGENPEYDFLAFGNVATALGLETSTIQDHVMGFTFESSVTFTEWWMKTGDERLIPDGTLVHQDLLLACNDTGAVTVTCTPAGRSVEVSQTHPTSMLSTTAPSLTDFERQFLLQGKALGTVVKLKSVEHFPFKIQSVTFRGSHYGKGLQYV